MNFALVSWNIRGLGKREKVRAICRCSLKNKAQVLLIQETKLEVIKPWVKARLGKANLGEVVEVPSEGVIRWSNLRMESEFFQSGKKNYRKRWIGLIGTLTEGNLKIVLININAPNAATERKRVFDQLSLHIESWSIPVIVAGDFNCSKPGEERIGSGGT
ncbi:hypothetical protein HRI_001492900 [Hibiscus trionum]|uniref:Endonuclease/exonuclease/phosphatase domain-containing protein n=1 Tax=Hibiscus trionum TaxID=183268 RepID=A0A9W7HJC7_HIBTR|nr:hypothetical protein HRI_001492900 [Hibiscus trionum]